MTLNVGNFVGLQTIVNLQRGLPTLRNLIKRNGAINSFQYFRYVLEGGAICLEILTSDGWSGVYTIEALILQVLAAFAKGKARVMFGQSTVSLN